MQLDLLPMLRQQNPRNSCLEHPYLDLTPIASLHVLPSNSRFFYLSRLALPLPCHPTTQDTCASQHCTQHCTALECNRYSFHCTATVMAGLSAMVRLVGWLMD
mmetsp:Transcript_25789/g.51760  ORF Transcript_25789/g.51760 Transcript_25789/m.51760 type:complete len:103 (-) Transcript_25789:410-718(-)